MPWDPNLPTFFKSTFTCPVILNPTLSQSLNPRDCLRISFLHSFLPTSPSSMEFRTSGHYIYTVMPSSLDMRTGACLLSGLGIHPILCLIFKKPKTPQWQHGDPKLRIKPKFPSLAFKVRHTLSTPTTFANLITRYSHIQMCQAIFPLVHSLNLQWNGLFSFLIWIPSLSPGPGQSSLSSFLTSAHILSPFPKSEPWW